MIDLPHPPPFEMSHDTRILYNRLALLSPGQEITFSELSALIGSPVSGGTPSLQSAKNRLLDHEGIWLQNVRGQGYRRPTDGEIAEAGPSLRRRLRNHARRASEKLNSIENFADLTPQQKLKHMAETSVLATMSQFLKSSSVKLVTKAVASAGHEIPVSETLALFSKQKEKA